MAYLNINGQDFEGVASFKRATTHNSDVARNLDGGLCVDVHNYASKRSYSFSFAVKGETDLAELETALVNIGQIPITIKMEDNVVPRIVSITNGTVQVSSVGGMFVDGVWNKGAGTITFGCEEI